MKESGITESVFESYRAVFKRELYTFSVFLSAYALVVLSANCRISESQNRERDPSALGIAHHTSRKPCAVVQAP